MNHEQVNRILAEAPERSKIVSLNDGKEVRIQSRERYLAGPVMLIVLDDDGDYVYVSYRNIASIRTAS